MNIPKPPPDTKASKRCGIYIAGPMRGMIDFNYPRFNAVAAKLEAYGWRVVNPVKIGEKYGSPEEINESEKLLEALVREELEQLKTCGAIFLLNGWRHSKGARNELASALIDGALVFFEEDAENGRPAAGKDGALADALADYIRETKKEFDARHMSAHERFARYEETARMAAEEARKAAAEFDRLSRAELAASTFLKAQEGETGVR